MNPVQQNPCNSNRGFPVIQTGFPCNPYKGFPVILTGFPCNSYRGFPVILTGFPCNSNRENLLGLQGNPCLDYKNFAVQGLQDCRIFASESLKFWYINIKIW